MHLADRLARGGIGPPVEIEGAIPVTGHRLGDHDPRVGVAEDAGVLLVPRRIRGDLPQLDAVAGVSGLQQHHAVFGEQPVAHAVEGLTGAAILDTAPGHAADPLGLHVDLPLVALLGPDGVAEEVVGAPEPGSVPAMLGDGTGHVGGGGEKPQILLDLAALAHDGGELARGHDELTGDEDGLCDLPILVCGGLE